ncbi:MAG: glycogen debranching enzyme family protein [Deltaproteobacteria bacterium]|jgi:predicted glycogen debranching enzyme|nr:glycogen debranching enzyme family protein [Deltaproteobacteria bacterium]
MTVAYDADAEWLEADGLGGFASGTVGGVRTRRYHALLLAATTPPAGRFVLVNGLEVWAESTAPGGFGAVPLSTQRYAPDVIHPRGLDRLASFEAEPWPRWTFRLPDGSLIIHELVVPRGAPAVYLSWRHENRAQPVRLTVRPLLSGRDPHALQRENPVFDFTAQHELGWIRWQPYLDVPGVVATASGSYLEAPLWYRQFLYTAERDRVLDCLEDLASPGEFRFELARGEALLVLAADVPEAAAIGAAGANVDTLVWNARVAAFTERAAHPSRLARAAGSYIVKRGRGLSIVAGYPWFGDWGRDTFIAVRGLCLATERFDDARQILTEWSGAVSDGMLPNRFPDRGDRPEYNAVDASLWYVIAVGELLDAAATGRFALAEGDRLRLIAAVRAILDGYARGTRYGIRLDSDGLVMCGEPGVQLTWMDAKVGEWVVTPRTGKPVEVEALWLNAVAIGARLEPRWREVLERGERTFAARFWNEDRQCLFDVLDADHHPGVNDASIRPNQLFAVGGLPRAVIDGERARRVVETVEARLWTPLGPRSLASSERGYAPRYEGGVRERDGAYHQGTVWPWLAGAFVEAWVRVNGGTLEAKRQARARFYDPLLRHLDDAGLGHVSEIADAEAPHTPRGCPFQAWSVGELLRLDRLVLAES